MSGREVNLEEVSEVSRAQAGNKMEIDRKFF